MIKNAIGLVALYAMMSTAPAFAQVVATSEASNTGLEEIVVTARRKEENLQNVPQTVNAISGEALQKLSIQQFSDIDTLVPGLTLTQDQNGLPAGSMRGISYVQSGSTPTIAFYVNDAPVYVNYIFDSLFDIGQVEVLKGPQGTTRGISAPSGAITVTSHRASTEEYGGYIEATYADLDGRNVQGAFNIPIIKGVLGLRIAGVYDENDVNDVSSIHNSLPPQSKREAARLSATFTPNDEITGYLTWDHQVRQLRDYLQVTGPGPGAFSIGDTLFPASVNPSIAPEDRLAVQDVRDTKPSTRDLVTGNLEVPLFGQRLSYVGSYYYDKSNNWDDTDTGNVLPGVGVVTGYNDGVAQGTTQEIRLASKPDKDRFFDYVVGGFYSSLSQGIRGGLAATILTAGAFGPTPVPDIGAYNPNYTIPVGLNYNDIQKQEAIFGNVTFHLGAKTELSAGLRHIWLSDENNTYVYTEDGLLSLPALGVPAATPCGAVIPGSLPGSNLGDCILPGAPATSDANKASNSDTIYNISLSHRLTEELMLYATVGTAYRPSTTTTGVQGDLATSTNPQLSTLTYHPAEKSTDYEIGIKTTWLDDRARVNLALFQQDFTNLVVGVPNVNYYNTVAGTTETQAQMYQSVKAQVRGYELSGDFLILKQWTASAQVSYADGKVQDTPVPCNTFGPNGQPVYNTDGLVSLCPGGSTSRDPLWNATLQTQYTQPFNDQLAGFLRLTGIYYPKNTRAEPGLVVDSYSLFNIYGGIQSRGGAWEVSLFAKNVFNTDRVLDIGQTQLNLNGPLASFFPQLIQPTNYYNTAVTPPRQVGITVHYSFGSR
jgi:iron complex outermembrane receptor protein